jgi:hypothetical protein
MLQQLGNLITLVQEFNNRRELVGDPSQDILLFLARQAMYFEILETQIAMLK